ncbi:nuclear transport factor 2 family protein [Alishewanella sp. BS5-314]|uniref:nuclear transport factor 2 family protein n=1 Tax=Alishewanella sp. BS5-314 TaxID=2755587 RepID=UPI0021BA5DEF|nr:nuclear transport factor 2 family protein [Alishewanella sp. BS5-314]MCT8126304.1 nuclear transport factor 2 family protein [Alishewanella sp. BS5-314]
MRAIFITLLLLMSSTAYADDRAELTALLAEFLDGATRNDPAVHDKYWAEELIYTSSAGRRFGKAELMQGVNSRGELPAAEISMRYSSEDLQILQYGDTAVVAFTLVGTSAQETLRFLNSGTFVKRNGKWQAVNWQATRKLD